MAGNMTKRLRIPVHSLPIHPRIISSLKRVGIHYVSSVLEYSIGELARRTGLDEADVSLLMLDASRAIVQDTHPTTALCLYQEGAKKHNWGRLSVGCSVLDSALKGGILVPGVTEIAGTSAAGKTQLCLQLCLTVQLSRDHGGLDGGAVYICTEDAFPNRRLQQLAHSFSQRHQDLGLTSRQLSDNIFVEHAATTSALSIQLEYKLPSLLEQGRVKLVVLDSIAALFRAEFGIGQTSHRAELLRAFGAQLWRLSEMYGAAVVCVNQVTAAVNSTNQSVRPALGLAWANVVGTRIVLHRKETVDNAADYSKVYVPVKRRLHVAFAPHLPPLTLQYYIAADGIHGVFDEKAPPSQIHANDTHKTNM